MVRTQLFSVFRNLYNTLCLLPKFCTKKLFSNAPGNTAISQVHLEDNNLICKIWRANRMYYDGGFENIQQSRCMLAVRGFRYSVSNSLSHHFNPQPLGFFKTYLFYCLERMFRNVTIFVNFAKISTNFRFSAQHLTKRQFYLNFFFPWGVEASAPCPSTSYDQFFAKKN